MLRKLEQPAESFTGRTLLLFDNRTTVAEFQQFANQLILESAGTPLYIDDRSRLEDSWRFSNAYHIGVAPIPPELIDLRRHAFYGLIAFAPERWLRLPEGKMGDLDGFPDIQDDPLDPLTRIGVRDSTATGKKIRVALLDSGVVDHPDFTVAGRATFVGTNVVTLSHGTRCAGIICGPRTKNGKNGYGIASDVYLFDGQIMAETNIVNDDTVLRAIEWADKTVKADIIVFAAGAKTLTNEPNPIFEHVARLLHYSGKGKVLIAAGGEGGGVAGASPVEHPANCQSIIAVGSVDRRMVAMPSTPGLVAGGDIVNFVAPGEDLETASLPNGGHPGYGTLSGTSAATAVAAGVASLWAHADYTARGLKLWEKIVASAETLPNTRFPIVGAGLIKAPPP